MIPHLEAFEAGKAVSIIRLDKRRTVFGRHTTCDRVVDHPSVSGQHAALIRLSNGRIYVMDLGSVHGTFIDNERLTKEYPIRFELGQCLRFAASSTIYILRKNAASFRLTQPTTAGFGFPYSDPPDNEAIVVASNTILNSLCRSKADSFTEPSLQACSAFAGSSDEDSQPERAPKRRRRGRVTFKDEHGGPLIEVMGTSDGVDVSQESVMLV